MKINHICFIPTTGNISGPRFSLLEMRFQRPSGFESWSAPSHYLYQYWIIVNCAFGNIFQWNLNENTTIFIEKKSIWKCRLENAGHLVSASMCKRSIPGINAPMTFQFLPRFEFIKKWNTVSVFIEARLNWSLNWLEVNIASILYGRSTKTWCRYIDKCNSCLLLQWFVFWYTTLSRRYCKNYLLPPIYVAICWH